MRKQSLVFVQNLSDFLTLGGFFLARKEFGKPQTNEPEDVKSAVHPALIAYQFSGCGIQKSHRHGNSPFASHTKYRHLIETDAIGEEPYRIANLASIQCATEVTHV